VAEKAENSIRCATVTQVGHENGGGLHLFGNGPIVRCIQGRAQIVF
jgi:hypothetical protein